MLHRVLTLTLLLQVLLSVSVASAAGIPITGHVLGPDGEPRAKAGVRLEPIPPTYERARLRLKNLPGPEPVASTRTGADGAFELTAPEAGMWKVVVSAPGMLAMGHRLVPLVDAAVLSAVMLMPAADLELRLVDAAGKPRPGRVGAVTLGRRNGDWNPQLRLAAAGEDGVAHLPLGHDEKIQLEVLADGHPLAVFELFDESSVKIDVPNGVAGTVRVTDQQKRPLAEAVAFQGSALVPLGLTDEEGRIPLVMQAEKRPSVRMSTADRWNGSFELDFSKATKDLRLDPPETVRGRVFDLVNRDPVGGALVWAVRGEFAATDEQGRYAVEVGVYKSRFVRAAAAGYQNGQAQLSEDAPEEVPPITLAPAANLSGKVVDREGALLAGVSIELSPMAQSGRLSPAVHRMMRSNRSGRTSDKGAFRIGSLPAGIGFQLVFKLRGFAPHTLDVDPLEPFESRSGLKIVLEPGRLAFGQVVDEDDVPIAGAEVALKAPPPSDPMAAMRMMRWRRDEADEPTYLTDSEGRFEIADLAAGSYDLAVRATGFAVAKVPGVRVEKGDGRVDFGTVVLVPGASIEGRVTGPDGVAIADAEITVDSGGRPRMIVTAPAVNEKAKTDSDGRFVIADLLPGQPVTLAVAKSGYASEAMTSLRPPLEEPLAIVLRAAARLKGKVVNQEGEPIKGAMVAARRDPRAMTSARMMRHQFRSAWNETATDGSFLIEDVEPGTLQVTADAEGYQQLMRTGVELAAGAERELELVLDAGAVVEGTVTTAEGEPVAQVSVNVTEPLEGFTGINPISASGQTDFEGHYRVTGAPTGPATINVYHGTGKQLQKNIEVKPGTNVVDLVLERGFEISGQVIAPDANPVGGAVLSIQPVMQAGMHFSLSNLSQEVSAGDGTFTLTGVKAGKYTVTASREGYAPARSEALDVDGDVTGLLLELSRGTALKGRVLGLDFDELGALALIAFSQHGGQRQGRVDFEGEYVFDNLAPGQWHVQAQVASGRSTALQVEVPEGVSEVQKDIEFGAGFALTGIVLDGGEPVVGANIGANGMMGSSGSGMTGDDGRFQIENLKAGSYQVMVMASMGVQHMEALELVGDHELRIELATGTVSGFVRDTAGEPLAGVAVTLEQLDAGDSMLGRQFGFGNRAESDSRGYFLVPRVRQGNWRAVATKAGYGPGETTVVVASGSAPEVEIRLTPTEGVSFQVVLESGAAVPAVQVVILGPGGQPLASGSHPVIDGKVRVSTVPPGQWELVVQGGDSASTRFVVNAPGDQGSLVLLSAGSLHLRVPDLEQVPMASMTLTGPDGKPYISSMGISFGPGRWMLSAGQTTVPSLVPGNWSFVVEHEGQTWSGSAMVVSGVPTEIILP